MTFQNNNQINLEKVTFVRPGGNDTAIIWDVIPRNLQVDISKDIQRQFDTVEQVMFVERQNDGTIRGQIAGNEFCGNATRSLGYLLLNEMDGQIIINVSGTDTQQTILVKDNFARTTVPIINKLDCVQADKDGFLVTMDGIAFSIIEKETIENGIDKEKAFDRLKSKGLAYKYPASGLLIIDRLAEGCVAIDPYIYVRDVETMYYETACASGSTAIGLMLSKVSKQSLSDIEIRQPSGMSLYVSVFRDDKNFISADVNGPIKVLSKKSITVKLPQNLKNKGCMMDRDEYFTTLEKNFLTYNELKSSQVKDNGEVMCALEGTGVSYSISNALPPSTGKAIYVREGMIARLINAQEIINDLFDGGVLDIVYGYRSLAVQTQKYQEIKDKLQSNYSNNTNLNEAIHKFIAVPDVAGHPTGGAVDVRLLDNKGKVINMGTAVHELVKESYVFNPFLEKSIWLNRQKLRQAMTSAGFAPFDGEWWHFSYGDQEWAAYYNKPEAIYSQIEFEG